MSNIHSNPDALRDFASALSAYQERMHDALARAEDKRLMAKHKIEAEVITRTQVVRQVQSEYESCVAEQQRREAHNAYVRSRQGSQTADFEPHLDCSDLATALREARSRLNVALDAQSRFNAAYGIYRHSSQRFTQALDVLKQHARPELMKLADQLDIYLIPAAETIFSGKVDGGSPKVEAPHYQADCEMTAIAYLLASAPPSFPENYAMFPLSALPMEQINEVKQHGFTKGYTEKDIEWAFDALHSVVLPALARGNDLDYFQFRDQQHGLYGTRSYTSTYLGFFRDDNAIAAEFIGSQWNLINGRHRVYVAKELGLSEIPMRLVAAP